MRLSLPAEILGDFVLLVRTFFGRTFEKPEGNLPGVAVVLGAQVLRGGRPSRTLRSRTLYAARLYEAGEVRLIVPTGGIGKSPPSEASVMAGILREAGVPEEDVILEEEAKNTWDSARFVAGVAGELSVERVRIVTDPLHCVRTAAAFEEAGLRAVCEPVYSSPMWRVRSMRLGQLAREMGAVVWYRTRHGVGRSRRLP